MKLPIVTLALFTACSPYSVTKVTTPVLPIVGASRVGVATVCVIRSARLTQAVSFVVHDNDTVVGATRGRSHFCYEAQPGNHTIVSSTHDSSDTPARLDAQLEAQRYWLLQDDQNTFGSVTSILSWIDEPNAVQAASGSAYTQLTDVRSGEKLPEPIPYVLAKNNVGSATP